MAGTFRNLRACGRRNTDLLAKQIEEFRPQVAVVADENVLKELKQSWVLMSRSWRSVSKPESMRARSRGWIRDVGNCRRGGHGSHLRGGQARKRVGLANKETLVASGKLIIEAMRASGTELLPVDSEHNGAHQAFRAGAAMKSPN